VEGKTEEAAKAFETIAASKEYPQVHRTEAAECRREAELAAKGLPPRNPEESRVRVPSAPQPGRVLHVSPTGKDSNEGTATQPFATVAKALESARAAGKRVQGQGSIRFDDIICGMLVYGNIFYKGGTGFGGVQMNCGRDNIIDNNLFLDCPVAVSGGFGDWNNFWKEGPSAKPRPAYITSDFYKARYPDLAKMFSPPCLNYLWRNAIVRCEVDIKWNPATYDRTANVIREEDSGFLKGAGLNRHTAPSVFTSMGLRPIPVDEIGLYPDPIRRGWINRQ